MRVLLFVRWILSVGAILWFSLVRVLGVFFFGSNYQRKSAEVYSYIVESFQLLTMHMGPQRQKTIRDAGQSEVPAEYEKWLLVVTGV